MHASSTAPPTLHPNITITPRRPSQHSIEEDERLARLIAVGGDIPDTSEDEILAREIAMGNIPTPTSTTLPHITSYNSTGTYNAHDQSPPLSGSSSVGTNAGRRSSSGRPLSRQEQLEEDERLARELARGASIHELSDYELACSISTGASANSSTTPAGMAGRVAVTRGEGNGRSSREQLQEDEELARRLARSGFEEREVMMVQQQDDEELARRIMQEFEDEEVARNIAAVEDSDGSDSTSRRQSAISNSAALPSYDVVATGLSSSSSRTQSPYSPTNTGTIFIAPLSSVTPSPYSSDYTDPLYPPGTIALPASQPIPSGYRPIPTQTIPAALSNPNYHPPYPVSPIGPSGAYYGTHKQKFDLKVARDKSHVLLLDNQTVLYYMGLPLHFFSAQDSATAPLWGHSGSPLGGRMGKESRGFETSLQRYGGFGPIVYFVRKEEGGEGWVRVWENGGTGNSTT
jgi:hypothetical protein